MALSIVTRWFALNVPYAWFDFATTFKSHDGYVGPHYFREYAEDAKAALLQWGAPRAIIPNFKDLKCDEFDPLAVDPLLVRFYTETSKFDLRIVRNEWRNEVVRAIGRAYEWCALRIGMLSIPTSGVGAVDSELNLLDVDFDGRGDYVCWVRHVRLSDGSERQLFYAGAFRAFLSKVEGRSGAYLGCVFPVPGGNVTAVLKLCNLENGRLRISSLPEHVESKAAYTKRTRTARYLGSHEAGSYLLLPLSRSFSMAPLFGLEEDLSFRVEQGGSGSLIRAEHRCYWLGREMFRLDYEIRPK